MTFSQRDFWFYLFFPRSSLKLNFWSINLQVLPFEHPSLLEFLITLLGVCTLGIFWNHEMCMHAFLLSQCKVLISFQEMFLFLLLRLLFFRGLRVYNSDMLIFYLVTLFICSCLGHDWSSWISWHTWHTSKYVVCMH